MIESNDYAAIVSAAGGLIAALAAGISAWSAHKANQQAGEAERRTALRQIALAANDAVITSERISDRSSELSRSYSTLAVFAGQSGGSIERRSTDAINEKMAWVYKLADRSRPFIKASETLSTASVQEREDAMVSVMTDQSELRAILIDMERELTGLEIQIAPYREKAIKG
jgi:hypothetical protein